MRGPALRVLCFPRPNQGAATTAVPTTHFPRAPRCEKLSHRRASLPDSFPTEDYAMKTEGANPRGSTRRELLKHSIAAVAFPMIVPSRVLGRGGVAPSEKITLGVI